MSQQDTALETMEKTTACRSDRQCRSAGKIYELLPKISQEVGAVAKERSGTGGINYSYRGIDDALNLIGPVFHRNKCFATFSVISHSLERNEVEGKVYNGKPTKRIEYHADLVTEIRFHSSEDGSFVTYRTATEGVDPVGGDKACLKAMSAAMKYALFLGLMIPVDGTLVEPEDYNGEERTIIDLCSDKIDAVTTLEKLAEYRASLKASDKLDEDQKKQVMVLIDTREIDIKEANKKG